MVESSPSRVEMRVDFCMASEELMVRSFTPVNLYGRSNLTETGTTSPVRQATVLLRCVADSLLRGTGI